MNDTSHAVAERVAEHHRQLTPLQRMRGAAAMFEAACVLVDASLPTHLDYSARRLARARRLYRDELPEAALLAHAEWRQEPDSTFTAITQTR
ncbi:MAG: hypothetical protein ACT4NL_11060 [Pseudomarimonas sp.]